MADYLDIDANLRCAMQFFGRASGSGEIVELDGSLGIFSGPITASSISDY